MIRRPASENRDPAAVDAERARALLAEGWQAADLHVHTLHSYDVIPTRDVDPLVLYHKARRMGMSFVAFTDHDTMAAYDEIGWTREGLVPAVEVKVHDPRNVGHAIHVNVYGLDRRQFREIREIVDKARDLPALTRYLRDEGLPYVFNHPFWHEPDDKPDLQAVLDIAPLFPVLEYNMGRIERINAQALRVANLLAKGIVAATDTHIGAVGQAFTLAQGRTFKEFFDKIASRESFFHPADLTMARFREEAVVRVQRLFNKAGWLHDKDSLHINTGNALLDGIVSQMARERAGTSRLSLRLLSRVIEAVSSSGIPGSLYLRSQSGLADRIGRLLESAGCPA